MSTIHVHDMRNTDSPMQLPLCGDAQTRRPLPDWPHRRTLAQFRAPDPGRQVQDEGRAGHHLGGAISGVVLRSRVEQHGIFGRPEPHLRARRSACLRPSQAQCHQRASIALVFVCVFDRAGAALRPGQDVRYGCPNTTRAGF